MQVPLGHAALVVDRHRRTISYGIIDPVLVEVRLPGDPEVTEGVLIARLDRGAGEAEAYGVGEDGPHIGAEILLLGPVGLVHHQNPVVGTLHGKLTQGSFALCVNLGLKALVVPVELEDRGDDRPARDAGHHDLPQRIDRLRGDGVRQSARLERLSDLVVQVDTVGEDHQVGVLHPLAADAPVEFQLQRREHHRQTLARALGVPDQPRLVLPIEHPLDHLVHGPELLVAADLLGGHAVAGLEDDEVGEDVEQPGGLQQGIEPLLRLVRELLGLARPRVTPTAPQLRRCRRPVHERDVVGGDVEQVGVEQPGDFLLGGAHLIDGVEAVLARVDRTLGLDDHQWDAVDVDHDVGLADDLALNAKLVGAGEFVVLDVIEVDHPDRLMGILAGHLAAVVATQHLDPPLVVGDSREVVEDGLGGGLGDAVDADQGLDQQRLEEHLVLARAEVFVPPRVDVVVAVLLRERVEDGPLDQRELGGGCHTDTRTLPVRRSWRRPALSASNRRTSLFASSTTARTESSRSTIRSCSSPDGRGTGNARSWVLLMEARLVVCFPIARKYVFPWGLSARYER